MKKLSPQTASPTSSYAEQEIRWCLSDLETNWKHPVLNKTVGELLELTPDKSSCTVVSFRQSARDMSFEQFNYVAFEGNIGAGKQL
jgi:hypothetical protein